MVIGIARAKNAVPRMRASTWTGPGRVPVVMVAEAKPELLKAVVGAMLSPPFGPKRRKSTIVLSTAAAPLASKTAKTTSTAWLNPEPRTPSWVRV